MMNRIESPWYSVFKMLLILPVILLLTIPDVTNTTVRAKEQTVIFDIPVEQGKVTLRFGDTHDPFSKKIKHHSGIDIGAPSGADVLSAADGVVIETGTDSGWGNYVIIAHPADYATKYGHLKKILVTKNETVIRGQVIALVGSTGKSTGPHLHFEVYHKEQMLNPEDVIDFHSLQE